MTGDPSTVAAHGPRVVVMGVSASGKSSVAAALAGLMGVRHIDADDLHPAANLDKMSRAVPLNDEDRWPWLDRVGQEIAGAPAAGIVVACSALRRVYRDRLRAAEPRAVFVHLTGSRELLEGRARLRRGHFMPATLLDSQLETLESLDSDESGVEMNIDASVADIARASRAWLASRGTEPKMTGVRE